jgi:hypothetical protein
MAPSLRRSSRLAGLVVAVALVALACAALAGRPSHPTHVAASAAPPAPSTTASTTTPQEATTTVPEAPDATADAPATAAAASAAAPRDDRAPHAPAVPTAPAPSDAPVLRDEVLDGSDEALPLLDVPTGPPLPEPVYRSHASEVFDSDHWYESWGFGQPDNARAMPEINRNGYLRVMIPGGSHSGTSFRLPMPDANVAHLRYRLRLGATFDPSDAASNVKLPGFGNPRLDARGACLGACGLAVADGITSYSARSDVRADGRPGWYVYDPDSALSLRFGRGERWQAEPFTLTKWHTIDQYIQLNTPGVRNGVLRTLIDGHQVFDRRSYVFRLVDSLHVGSAWFDVYYGGSGQAPIVMYVDVDDIFLEWG